MVIVDAADELNINAANALLKSLEEPPTRGAVPADRVGAEPAAADHPLALPAAGAGAAGGRSAARGVEAALTAAEMAMPDAQRWPLLERLAEGSVRRALQLAGSGGLELLRAHRGASRRPAAGRLAGGAYARRPALARRQRAALRGLFRSAAGPAGAAGPRARGAQSEAPELALAERLIPEAKLPAWAALWEASCASARTRRCSTSTARL